MKNTIKQFAALALGLGMATTASAALVIGDNGTGTLSFLPGYSNGAGAFPRAEYTWTFVTSTSTAPDVPPGSAIQTFCLEFDIPAGDGRFIVNSKAEGGGVNTNAGDPISQGTSFLYSHFADQTLAGYNFTPGAGRIATAIELQLAIWALEDEIAAPVGNQFYNLALDNGGKADAAPGANGVFAMNITGANGEDKQDLLVARAIPRVPEGGSTFIVLGLSLCGLSIVRSRLQKKA